MIRNKFITYLHKRALQTISKGENETMQVFEKKITNTQTQRFHTQTFVLELGWVFSFNLIKNKFPKFFKRR